MKSLQEMRDMLLEKVSYAHVLKIDDAKDASKAKSIYNKYAGYKKDIVKKSDTEYVSNAGYTIFEFMHDLDKAKIKSSSDTINLDSYDKDELDEGFSQDNADDNDFISISGSKKDVQAAVKALKGKVALNKSMHIDSYEKKGVYYDDYNLSGSGYVESADVIDAIKKAKIGTKVDIVVSINNQEDEY